MIITEIPEMRLKKVKNIGLIRAFFEALYGVYGKIVRLHLEMYDSSINR